MAVIVLFHSRDSTDLHHKYIVSLLESLEWKSTVLSLFLQSNKIVVFANYLVTLSYANVVLVEHFVGG